MDRRAAARSRGHRAACHDLVRLAPHRESGYRLLMRALAEEDNVAESLVVYEQRVRLREDLGASPSLATQELHRDLLG